MEVATIVKTDDGLTNVDSNVVQHIQLNNEAMPSGIVWFIFDRKDIIQKTCQENRDLYVNGANRTWTPIKPATTQFAVGKRSLHKW